MGQRLLNKKIVITGGTSGIGLATAKLFLEEGAEVAIVGRGRSSIADAVKNLSGKAIGIQADVSRIADLEKMKSEVIAKWDRIDVLFANAGVANFVPLDQVDEAFFDQIIDTNLKGLYFTVQKFAPFLNDNASVILTGSSLSVKGRPGGSVYAASKAAVRSLARSLSSELVERGIRVNVLSPGPIETPIFARMDLPREKFEAMMDTYKKVVPLKRMGKPEEIAKAALFLASADSSYVIGAELFADGGIAQL